MAHPTLSLKSAPQGQLALDLEPQGHSRELEVQGHSQLIPQGKDNLRSRVEVIIATGLLFAIFALAVAVMWVA